MCSVAMAEGVHPIPFRTRKLSPPAPMVLRRRPWESRTSLNTSNGFAVRGAIDGTDVANPTEELRIVLPCLDRAGPAAGPAAVMRGWERRWRFMEKERVQAVLDKIRPALQADGGDVELVDVEGGVVKVKLVGACAGCPMSQLTLANGVERVLKEQIPEVERVEPVM